MIENKLGSDIIVTNQSSSTTSDSVFNSYKHFRTHNFPCHIVANISLLLWISDTTIADDICRFTFWAVWRVYHLRNTFVASSLPQQNSSCGRVSKDVSANRLSAVSSGEESRRTRIGLDLVGL
jgi:hypothetical protein